MIDNRPGNALAIPKALGQRVNGEIGALLGFHFVTSGIVAVDVPGAVGLLDAHIGDPKLPAFSRCLISIAFICQPVFPFLRPPAFIRCGDQRLVVAVVHADSAYQRASEEKSQRFHSSAPFSPALDAPVRFKQFKVDFRFLFPLLWRFHPWHDGVGGNPILKIRFTHPLGAAPRKHEAGHQLHKVAGLVPFHLQPLRHVADRQQVSVFHPHAPFV